MLGSMPIGALLADALASAIGVRAASLVTAIGSGLALLWICFSQLRWLRGVPAEAEDLISPRPASQ